MTTLCEKCNNSVLHSQRAPLILYMYVYTTGITIHSMTFTHQSNQHRECTGLWWLCDLYDHHIPLNSFHELNTCSCLGCVQYIVLYISDLVQWLTKAAQSDSNKRNRHNMDQGHISINTQPKLCLECCTNDHRMLQANAINVMCLLYGSLATRQKSTDVTEFSSVTTLEQLLT